MPERVHIIGTGLIGTSLAIALTQHTVEVTLADASPTTAALAADLSGGEVADGLAADIVVVATPPDVTAAVVAAALARHPEATVTDVASVKGVVRAELAAAGAPGLGRYVGGHPMAGRERSGAISARGDLFEGRPWVVAAVADTEPDAVALVKGMAEAVGSVVTLLDPGEHDEAVAAVSHVPQIAASLVAARLADLPDTAVALAGQGVRDVTRIAASDPQLWTQILAGNAPAVARVLRAIATDLSGLITALEALGPEPTGAVVAPGARAALAGAIQAGNAGHARIPGKHGAAPTAYAKVVVLISDRPGQLGRLFQDVADAGINLEELVLEHSLGAQFGLLELSVLPGVEAELRTELTRKGWRLHA
ncbi:MAG: prephenate dehydrogenase [Tetrasphaera sp.]